MAVEYTKDPTPISGGFSTSDIVAIEDSNVEKGTLDLLILNYPTTKIVRDVIGVDGLGKDIVITNEVGYMQKLTLNFDTVEQKTAFTDLVVDDLVSKTNQYYFNGVVESESLSSLVVNLNSVSEISEENGIGVQI